MSAKRQSSILSFFHSKGKISNDDNLTESLMTKNKPDEKASIKMEQEDNLRRIKRIKNINDDDTDKSPIKKSSVKRRRIIVSSDEEDADIENKEDEISVHTLTENVPLTPKSMSHPIFETPKSTYRSTLGTPKSVSRPIFETPKSAYRSTLGTPKSVFRSVVGTSKSSGVTPRVRRSQINDNTTSFSPQLAESFINSFRADHESLDDTLASVATLDRSIYDLDDKKLREEEKRAMVEEEKYMHEKLDWLKPERIRDAQGRNKSAVDYDPTTLLVPPDFLKEQTPGHRQWWVLKAANFDTLLLFKVGKFYELYHMDAVIAVDCLSLAYMRGSYAHCGFPEAAYGKFSDQLVSRGFKVARIEQTETPQQLEERNNQTKGPKDKVVRRELCRVTTCGTRTYGVLDGSDGGVIDSSEGGAKFLLALKEEIEVVRGKSIYGICFVDTAIGKFFLGQFADDDCRSYLRTMLASNTPAQVLFERSALSSFTKAILNSMLSIVPKEALVPKRQFLTPEDTVKMLMRDEFFGGDYSDWPLVLRSMLDTDESVLAKPASNSYLVWSALGAVLNYLKRCMIDVDMVTMRNFERFEPSLCMRKTDSASSEELWANRQLVLDGVTLENLNLVPYDKRDPQAASLSLFNTINKCFTAFGKRLLRQWICSPTCSSNSIRERQEAVEWLMSPEANLFTEKAIELLRKIPDLERLLQKVHTFGLKYRAESHPDSRAVMFEASKYNRRKIKDLLITLDGFDSCQKLSVLYNDCHVDGNRCSLLDTCFGFNDDSSDFACHLQYYKESFNRVLAEKDGIIVPDRKKDAEYDIACTNVEDCVKQLELYKIDQEKKLGCKIGFQNSGKNRYQLEIPDSKTLSRLYELKGRRKGFGRYMTVELEELVENLAVAEANKHKLADDATRKIFANFDSRRSLWSNIVSRIASFDVILSLSRYALTCGLAVCKPEFIFDSKEPFLSIENGYHPCLATRLSSCSTVTSNFIANDTHLGGNHPLTVVLTGPNMGGKSTLMRQVAVLAVLAHMGSLVPASSMRLTPIDRIFTRIGANDRLLCGQSTFFVELNETKVILRDATRHSLVLIDELGRGTSTFDGTAIATAVLKELAKKMRCRAYFSTHYHSLCQIDIDRKYIAHAHMACMVENENEADPTEESVTFLYRLVNGICPKSYGFYAARLAGIHPDVIRAAHAASVRVGATRSSSGSANRLRKIAEIRDAVKQGTSIDELRRMIEVL